MENSNTIDKLLGWMNASTCNFLAVKTITNELIKAGFKELRQGDKWTVIPGEKYFMVKNDSAVFAFVAGTDAPAEYGFHIISAHSDSPCFKVKPNAEIYGEGGVVSLNVEKYGGGILYTWFDRPLSMSGRVMTASGDPLKPRSIIFDLGRAVATIPHLAIHFNRAVNEGNPLSVQDDMKPVIGYFSEEEICAAKSQGGFVKKMVAEHIDIRPEEIIDYEICLYPYEKAELCGANGEYFQSGRIDDLSMAFAGLEALLNSCDAPSKSTRVLAIFDNEETGSGTKQGAHSPVLRDLLERVALSYGGNADDFFRSIANSFMVSADDAHAWHPNYNKKYDPTNHPVIGGGPAIKINANCKYMTDANGAAVFRNLCEKAGVKCQTFVNHSDVAGGSTLGNILTGQMDLAGVDMGAPIWAMHSARETAGVADHEMTVKVFTEFYHL